MRTLQSQKISSGLQRPSVGMDALCFTLLNSRTVMHIAHLGITGSGSYATHMALGAYYDAIGDLTDGLVEQHQGVTEVLMKFPDTATIPTLKSAEQCCGYLKNLRVTVDREQQACPYSELVNILDEIKSLIDGTCYKLTFLK